MNYLLDTCVVSELTRPKPHRRVAQWIRSAAETRLYLSVLTLGELRKGTERLPESHKRNRIDAWLSNELRNRFSGRILPVDDEVAERWGMESAKAERSGIATAGHRRTPGRHRVGPWNDRRYPQKT